MFHISFPLPYLRCRFPRPDLPSSSSSMPPGVEQCKVEEVSLTISEQTRHNKRARLKKRPPEPVLCATVNNACSLSPFACIPVFRLRLYGPPSSYSNVPPPQQQQQQPPPPQQAGLVSAAYVSPPPTAVPQRAAAKVRWVTGECISHRAAAVRPYASCSCTHHRSAETNDRPLRSPYSNPNK